MQMLSAGATKERKVMFAVESALEGEEFESVCTRRRDGTVDMESANLARMCTLLKEKVNLPYRQNKQVARYHLYANENIRLPAGTAVEADLGYRIQIKPGLMVHTYAGSRVQLVNLPSYDQQISKGATICSAMVTRDLNCPAKNQLWTKERT